MVKSPSVVPSVRWSAGGVGGFKVVGFRIDAGAERGSEQEQGRIGELDSHRMCLGEALEYWEGYSAERTRRTRRMGAMVFLCTIGSGLR